MNKLVAFVRLDFLTIKPYITQKNMLLYGVVIVYLAYIGGPSAGMATGLMFGALFTSYPFLLGEKTNMDALYTTLLPDRKTVVTGRYLFTLVFNLCMVVVMLAVTAGISIFTGSELPGEAVLEALAAAGVILIVVVILQSAQLPIFFKLGYIRARLYSFVPLFLLMGAVIVLSFYMVLSPENDMTTISMLTVLTVPSTLDPVLTTIGAIALLAAVVLISYRTSLSIYLKREF